MRRSKPGIIGRNRLREPYQYGVRRDGTGTIEVVTRRKDAEDLARDWAISPLRTGARQGELCRRRGYDGPWVSIATWRSPEAHR